MLMSGFPEECLSSQWFDVEQSNSKLDIVLFLFHNESSLNTFSSSFFFVVNR